METGGRALASERRIVARLSEACYAKENSNREELASERRATFSEACCPKRTPTAKNSPRRGERLSPRRVARKTCVREELASERRATFSEACRPKNLRARRTRLGEAHCRTPLRGVSPERKLEPRRTRLGEAHCRTPLRGVLRERKLEPRRTRLGEASDFLLRDVGPTAYLSRLKVVV